MKDVHTEGGVMSKVDKCRHGEGVLSYSGRSQTVPFLCESLQLLGTVFQTNCSEICQSLSPLNGIMNSVLHSNFDICVF